MNKNDIKKYRARLRDAVTAANDRMRTVEGSLEFKQYVYYMELCSRIIGELGTDAAYSHGDNSIRELSWLSSEQQWWKEL